MAEVRESYLLYIKTTDPARIWSGFGPLVIPGDAVDDGSAPYLGAGDLLEVPDFQQLINGVAERIDFEVSGVSAETLRLALDDAPTVANSPVYVGRVDFDENWQIIGPVEWEATFRADTLIVDSQAEGGRRVRTIKLSVGTDDTGRTYSPISFFTDADQRLRAADDAFFDHVAQITSGSTRIFGPIIKEQ